MRFIALCRPADGVDPQTEFAPYLAAERVALRQLRNAGVLLEAYSPGTPGAVLILEADDLTDADMRLRTLPLRTSGLLTVEVLPIEPMDLD